MSALNTDRPDHTDAAAAAPRYTAACACTRLGRRAFTGLLLDNGIATITFLTSGGVPILLKFAFSLDVLLVVLILHVFTGRMRTKFGGTSVDQLRELHD